MLKRDPRKDPKPGDQVENPGERFAVTHVTDDLISGVPFNWIAGGWRSMFGGEEFTREEWLEYAEKATVLNATE